MIPTDLGTYFFQPENSVPDSQIALKEEYDLGKQGHN